MHLFGTSGIRRIADRNLVELTLQVGLAVGTIYKRVVVGRDTRTSGNAMLHAVISGILASGANCYDAGVLPTPTLGLVTREFEAGVMITASHNPPQYNGLKLLNPDGSAFSSVQQKQIEDLIGSLKLMNIRWEKMQSCQVYTTAIEKHISRILLDCSHQNKLKVVVDCGCGAAYFITPEMLTRMGCEVIALNCNANGIFPHDIEPIENNLGDLMTAVKANEAALGIAHDGDADRMMAVDDHGRFISGDKLLAIFSRDSGSSEIVTTIDASMSIEEMGFKVKRTKVGDPYISEELKNSTSFGGEPSGAWVFPQISLCPDGIYGAARIVDIARRQKLSELVDSIPSHPVVRGSIAGTLRAMDSLKEKLQLGLRPDSIETIDGIKLIFKNGWLLVRPSGTEPKIRISSEAHDEISAHNYYNKGVTIIQNCIREG
jgi:phosphoglucosamine mutase